MIEDKNKKQDITIQDSKYKINKTVLNNLINSIDSKLKPLKTEFKPTQKTNTSSILNKPLVENKPNFNFTLKHKIRKHKHKNTIH